MLHVFIINPTAGRPGAAKRAAQTVRDYCQDAGLDYHLCVADSPGDAVRLTRHYAESGKEARIYACGGDGTLNQVVQAAAGRPNLAVTNLPTGTGNDFLKIFGPDCRQTFWDLAALTEGPQRAMDLIDCNGRLGLDIVCAGVDARIARDVHAFPALSGKGAYVTSLVHNLVFKGVAQEMRVTMGGQVWSEPITLLCVCNGRYYGGGFMPVAEAMPDDGVLEALLVPQVSRLTFARLVGDYAKGAYARHPDLIKPYRGRGPITLEAREPIAVCIDGEVTESCRVTVALAESKVNFFWPQGVDYQAKIPSNTGKMGK